MIKGGVWRNTEVLITVDHCYDDRFNYHSHTKNKISGT